MQWIDSILLGMFDLYGTNNIYELCDLMNIKIIKVEPNNPLLNLNHSLYIRDYYETEVIYIKNDLNEHYEQFYLCHELGHAILHPEVKNSLNKHLINNNKLEKQANYFASKLMNLTFDELYLEQFTIEQISSYLEVPLMALKGLVNSNLF